MAQLAILDRGPGTSSRLSLDQLTNKIIGAAIEIHRTLGPGLPEPAYEACLAYDLRQLGLRVEQQKAVPLIYQTMKLDCGFRADLLVEGRVTVEFKCKEGLHPVDRAQVLSHLRLLGLRVGLLMNFHVVLLKDGLVRVVNDYRGRVRIWSWIRIQNLKTPRTPRKPDREGLLCVLGFTWRARRFKIFAEAPVAASL